MTIQDILNKYETIKKLVEKYPDLEYISDNEFISRSLGQNCDYFEINYDRVMCCYFLKVGIIELNKRIWIDYAYYLEDYDRDNLIKYLNENKIKNSLIEWIIAEAERHLQLL